MIRRRYSSILCMALLGVSVLTSCRDEKSHATQMPHAAAGQLALVAGNGYTGLDERAELPNVQVPVPTGIAAYRDGSLLALANGDGGTLIYLGKSGIAEPFEYYRTNKKSRNKDVNFDTSQSPQKGWLRQQNSSSLIKTSNGELWIYANRWIAKITPQNQAIVAGRLNLSEYKNQFDYETRLFNGVGDDILLTREGKLYQITHNLNLRRYDLPEKMTDITSAAPLGNQLLLGGTNAVYHLDGKHIIGKDEFKLDDNKSAGDVVSLTADSYGGYFAATSAGVIFHTAKGQRPVLVAGVGHKPEKGFDGNFSCPPAGQQHLASSPIAVEIGDPDSMLLQSDQLYIADAACNRIYALGITRT